MLPRNRWFLAAMLAALIGGLAVWTLADDSPSTNELRVKRPLGLMTSLPIYWPEADGIEDMLQPVSGDTPVHWVRSALEESFTLVPLDTLHADASPNEETTPVSAQLAKLDLLILAQPHTLVPADNVALDKWVRQGGRLLMFADPVLTEHSRFAFGDKRRPQDVGLVPPVFARWGLAQEFDEAQPVGERITESGRLSMPVNMSGTFKSTPLGEANSGDSCKIDATGLIAFCHIGSGFALIVADVAVLEKSPSPMRETALRFLTEWAFIRPSPQK